MLAVLGYSRQIPNEEETSDLEIDLEISPDFEDIQSQTENNGTQIPSADGKTVIMLSCFRIICLFTGQYNIGAIILRPDKYNDKLNNFISK